MKNITYISAGAGSGKTTRIIDELVNAITNEKRRPSEIMMTTFTRAAAQEMQERAKKKLLELNMPKEANEMGAATIGTIHSVCLRLQPHELQHTRPPCPSPTPRVHSDSRPSSW